MSPAKELAVQGTNRCCIDNWLGGSDSANAYSGTLLELSVTAGVRACTIQP